MDKITESKNEFRARQWTQIIQSCQSSGMTITSWCSQNNINIKTYYYWLRKLRTIACESESSMQKQSIVPIAFSNVPKNSAITIHFNSISVDINNGASSETIQAVITALKTIC